ncbi:hypothetical protein ACFQ68_16605 [Amycolatopsis japonica]|uniref:hypothetical protein n=1 Tax=Amycolatopsis japonica TaxID=208439 RepID=UPI003670D136
MAQQSPDGRPGNRPDPARPSRARRGGDRAPYPGARTTAAAGRQTRATSRPEAPRRRAPVVSAAPTPATVWTCGGEPIDACTRWPVPIVESITAAFTVPGAHVVLVDIDTAPTLPEGRVVAARDAVRALDRTADTLTVDTGATLSGSAARPFWADLVTGPPAARVSTSPTGTETPGTDVGERADLVLVSVPARAGGTAPLDRLALLAANRLRHGGIFAVYTHSDWNQGELVDPTGAIVAACQHADLLYLQHIVTLHAPVRQGRLHAVPSAAAAAEYDRARQRAAVRGLPAPHLRAHGDVLVFAQPADTTGESR